MAIEIGQTSSYLKTFWKTLRGKVKQGLYKKSYFAMVEKMSRKKIENLIYFPNCTQIIVCLPSICAKLLTL